MGGAADPDPGSDDGGADAGRWVTSLHAEEPALRHRLLASVWLIFLIFPLGNTWQSHDSLAHCLLVTVIAVAFAGAFVWFSAASAGRRRSWAPHQYRLVAVLFLAAVVFLCMYDRGSWTYLTVYALMPALRMRPQRIRYRVVLTFAALALALGLSTGLSGGDVIAPACVVLGSGAGWMGMSRLIEANEALARARDDEARSAVAEERLRFSRDLHDLLGHSLSVITLKSEVAGRLLPEQAERARGEIAEIEDVARRALREVRDAVSGYRCTTLAVELAGARSALAAAGVTWNEELAVPAELPEAVEATLGWTVREGVTNVIRHSHARHCCITVTGDDRATSVTVLDDGTGAGATEPGGPGHGLTGLRERVAEVDGVLAAGPEPSGGFRLEVSVPRRSWSPTGVWADRGVPVPPAPGTE